MLNSVEKHILAFLETQMFPKSFREIHIYLQSIRIFQANANISRFLKTLIKENLIEMVRIDDINHYKVKEMTEQTENKPKTISDIAKKLDSKPTNIDTQANDIQPVQAFTANDGTLFLNKSDALAHNVVLDLTPKIEFFFKETSVKKNTKGIYINVIRKWEIWKQSNEK